MKNQTSITLALAIGATSLTGLLHAEQAQTNRLNRFSFDARFGLNVTARFKNLGRLTLQPATRTTPDGTPYNYDDGYVLTDISGNYGGQTWNWGYDQPSQISGNNILMSRTQIDANTASPAGKSEDNPNLGAELAYNRELGQRGKMHYGIEAAVNFFNISLQDKSSFAGGVFRTTDAYPFTPGTTPPLTPPTYQGTYAGPGFVLGDTPVSSTTTFLPGGANITGQRQFDANIWGFRLGPYAQIPLGTNFDLSFSAGLAAGLVCSSASWHETVTVTGGPTATSAGRGSDMSLLLGGYASAKATYHLSQRWSLEGGVQFQTLGVYDKSVGGRKVELDLSKSIFIVVGLGYSF